MGDGVVENAVTPDGAVNARAGDGVQLMQSQRLLPSFRLIMVAVASVVRLMQSQLLLSFRLMQSQLLRRWLYDAGCSRRSG
jgi:hypothetical protein